MTAEAAFISAMTALCNKRLDDIGFEDVIDEVALSEDGELSDEVIDALLDLFERDIEVEVVLHVR